MYDERFWGPSGAELRVRAITLQSPRSLGLGATILTLRLHQTLNGATIKQVLSQGCLNPPGELTGTAADAIAGR